MDWIKRVAAWFRSEPPKSICGVLPVNEEADRLCDPWLEGLFSQQRNLTPTEKKAYNRVLQTLFGPANKRG